MAHFVYPAANPQPAAAYPTVQTAYVAAAPQAAYAAAAAPRAAGAYDGYQATHATPQYAYTTRTQVAVTPAATYDQKAYYQPAAAQAAVSYSTGAETHYQPVYVPAAAKPVYSTNTTYNATPRVVAQPKVQAPAQASSAATYVYPTAVTTQQPASSYSTTYAGGSNATTTVSYTSKATQGVSNYTTIKQTVQPVVIKGYDAALYSAATSYYQQQQAAKVKVGVKTKTKMPPKQPQLHYCDVCKISCAGPQTYREHLEGQKHKKKEAAMKSQTGTPSSSSSTPRGQNQLRCELCDVTCTGADAYAAHIRGAKHQKVLKLHTRLGKPIPSTNPVVLSTTTSSTAKTGVATNSTTLGIKPGVKTVTAAVVPTVTKKVTATPKITFVGGTQLKILGVKTEEVKVEEPMNTSIPEDDKDDGPLNILGEKDVAPVGHEYIEEVKNEHGKTISFNCKLCECKFNDPNAKDMHMKGRRHRLQYKKKVDPHLQVEVKPSIRARKLQEEKMRRQQQKEEYWRRKEQEARWREEMRMEEEMYWDGRDYYDWRGRPGLMPPRPFLPGAGPMGPMRRPETSDDRHVMAKHSSIYPNEAELQAVQNIVSLCEKSLKLVSDFLAESLPKKMDVETKEVTKDAKEGEKKEDNQPPRVLKGVMRVGVLAKGLLLHGDLNVHLVVLCSEKPTRTLLERVADNLPKQIAACLTEMKSEDKFEVRRCVEEAAIIVTSDSDIKTSCTVTLTSPVMRESATPEGGKALCSVLAVYIQIRGYFGINGKL